MSKYYFSEHDENCYPLQYWIDYVKDNEIPELTVYEARSDKNTDYMFCKENQEVGEKGNCGKQCDDYKPKNGKSGACIYLGKVYEKTNIKKTIKLLLFYND